MDHRALLMTGIVALAGCLGTDGTPLSVQGGQDPGCLVTQPTAGGEALELHCTNVEGTSQHQAARACSGPDGTLDVDAVIDAGTLAVTVVDGAGAVVVEEVRGAPYDGGMQSRLIPSAPGTWTLTAETSPGFDGAFRLELTCPVPVAAP